MDKTVWTTERDSFGSTNGEPMDTIPCKVIKIGRAIDNESITLNRAQDGYVRFSFDGTKAIIGRLRNGGRNCLC